MLVNHALFSMFPRLLWNEHVRLTLGDDAARPVRLRRAGVVRAPTRGRCTGRGPRPGAAAGGRPAPDDRAAGRVPAGQARVRRVRRARAWRSPGCRACSTSGTPGRRRGGSPTRSRTTSRCSASGSPTTVCRRSARTAGSPWPGTPRRSGCAAARTSSWTSSRPTRGPVVVDGLSVRFPARVASDVGFSCLLPLLRSRSAADVADGPARLGRPGQPGADRGRRRDGAQRRRGPRRDPRSRRTGGCPTTPGPTRRGRHRGTALAEPAPVTDVAVDANERPARRRARPRARVRGAVPGAADPRAARPSGGPFEPADMAAIHGDTLLGSADELLGWVRRADDLSPEAVALRDRLLAWDRHMAADSVDAGAFAAWRTEVAVLLTAHPALAPLHRPHGRGVLFDPWLAVVGPRVADALPRLLGAAGARDRRCGGGARGAGAGRVGGRRRPDLGRPPPAPAGPRPCSASPARRSMPSRCPATPTACAAPRACRA